MNNKVFSNAFMDSWNSVLEQRQFIEEPQITAYKSYRYTARYLKIKNQLLSIGRVISSITRLLSHLLGIVFLKPYLYITIVLYMLLRFAGIDIFPPLGDGITRIYNLYFK